MFCFSLRNEINEKPHEIEEIGGKIDVKQTVALPPSKRASHICSSIVSIDNVRHGYIASVIVVAIRLTRYTYFTPNLLVYRCSRFPELLSAKRSLQNPSQILLISHSALTHRHRYRLYNAKDHHGRVHITHLPSAPSKPFKKENKTTVKMFPPTRALVLITHHRLEISIPPA